MDHGFSSDSENRNTQLGSAETPTTPSNQGKIINPEKQLDSVILTLKELSPAQTVSRFTVASSGAFEPSIIDGATLQLNVMRSRTAEPTDFV